ncbi:hypothetical protein F5Y18DRAFT_347219 [Xylariaceae sp. FL1019]|nr:hypothetical protein F5Y18DRAFT_347219 [Xylariaceae sp. FL1019]
MGHGNADVVWDGVDALRAERDGTGSQRDCRQKKADIFLEGQRYSPQAYAKWQTWCNQNNHRQPLNLLEPRHGTFINLVKILRRAPHVKAIYDLTIAYEHEGKFFEAPTMWETFKLEDISITHGYQFHIMARRYPLENLPQGTDDELAAWLTERWFGKGEWLEAMRLHRCRSIRNSKYLVQ